MKSSDKQLFTTLISFVRSLFAKQWIRSLFVHSLINANLIINCNNNIVADKVSRKWKLFYHYIIIVHMQREEEVRRWARDYPLNFKLPCSAQIPGMTPFIEFAKPFALGILLFIIYSIQVIIISTYSFGLTVLSAEFN